MPLDALEDLTEAPPDDYAAYEAYMNNRGVTPENKIEDQTPAAGENTPPSESTDPDFVEPVGQTAEVSETSDTPEQVAAASAAEEAEADQEKDTRLARRMRKLTGTIAELQARLDELQPPVTETDEPSGEVASPPEPTAAPAAKPAEALKRPMLRDFEDTDTQSAFDLYEAAMDTYNDAKTAQRLAEAIEAHKAELAQKDQETNQRVAKAAADAAWNQAASRYPDYNEVVARDEVQISGAMEAVMRMDPVMGTQLAYYLGQHPEESLAIANETLAPTQGHWAGAMARAGMRLGEIKAKLSPPPAPKTAAAAPPKTAAAAPKAAATPAPTTPKKVSSASPPPPQIRGGSAPPKFDVTSETDAADVGKWMKAREAQLAAAGRR